MKKIEIIQVGNPIIRKKGEKISFPISETNKQIIKDLKQAMKEQGVLVGMSAPQIGQLKNIFIVSTKPTKFRPNLPRKEWIFINPKIIRYSRKKVKWYDGCGSVAEANIFGEVVRSQNIDIEYFTIDGKKKKERFEDFVAVIIQHEYDHLQGIIFLDRMKGMSSIMSGIEYEKYINNGKNKNYKKLEKK